MVLHLDLDELAEEAADSMQEKLQLTAEWNEWEEQKEGLDEERNRIRVPTVGKTKRSKAFKSGR